VAQGEGPEFKPQYCRKKKKSAFTGWGMMRIKRRYCHCTYLFHGSVMSVIKQNENYSEF
jgi:hypothetical protein